MNGRIEERSRNICGSHVQFPLLPNRKDRIQFVYSTMGHDKTLDILAVRSGIGTTMLKLPENSAHLYQPLESLLS